MGLATATRLIIIPVIIASLWRQIKYIYNEQNVLSKYTRVNYLITGGLAIIAVITSIPQPTSLWLRNICILSTHQALLIYYYNTEQVIKGEIVVFYKRRMYAIITIISLVVIIIGFFDQNNLTWFVDNRPFQPTAIYYASHIIFYSVGLYIGILGVKQQYLFSKRINSTTLMFRNWLNALAFLLVALGALIVDVNVLIYILIGDIYRYALNQFYHELRIVFGITILILSATSPILVKILVPVNYLVQQRHRRKQVLITYLHEKLTQLVPAVRLPVEQGEHTIRQLVEIGDARDIVWSHVCHPGPITPAEEAELLFSLELKNITINEPGAYETPVIQQDVMQHNLKVAQCLRKLEQRRNATAETAVPPSNPSTRRPSSSR
jgi:hypothetical protein